MGENRHVGIALLLEGTLVAAYLSHKRFLYEEKIIEIEKSISNDDTASVSSSSTNDENRDGNVAVVAKKGRRRKTRRKKKLQEESPPMAETPKAPDTPEVYGQFKKKKKLRPRGADGVVIWTN